LMKVSPILRDMLVILLKKVPADKQIESTRAQPRSVPVSVHRFRTMMLCAAGTAGLSVGQRVRALYEAAASNHNQRARAAIFARGSSSTSCSIARPQTSRARVYRKRSHSGSRDARQEASGSGVILSPRLTLPRWVRALRRTAKTGRQRENGRFVGSREDRQSSVSVLS